MLAAALLLLIVSPTKPAAASVSWSEDLTSALSAARNKHDLVFVDFAAPWCYSCHYMDEHVLNQPEIQGVAGKAELVRLDVDSTEGARLRGEYQVLGLPNYVVLDENGKEVGRIVGEQTKESFFEQVNDILDRHSPLAGMEAEARAGGPKASAVAVLALKAFNQKHAWKEGLTFYDALPKPVKVGLETHPAGRIELLRLKLYAAYESKDTDSCERYGRVLLEGRSDCDQMYDATYLQLCLDGLPTSQRKKAFSFERRPIEELLQRAVFSKAQDRCADLETPVEVAVRFYRAEGENRKASQLLSRMILRTLDELGGDVARDRNKADNLVTFLELADDQKTLGSLYPKLAAAYSKDYVYPYQYGRFLLGQGDAVRALSVLDGAKKLAYGAGVLRVAHVRAKALAKLGRKAEAAAELDAALKYGDAVYPRELAAAKKTRAALNN